MNLIEAPCSMKTAPNRAIG